jgi:hypothetical protein
MNNCKPKHLPRQKQILGLLPTCTRRTEDVLLQYKLITKLKTIKMKRTKTPTTEQLQLLKDIAENKKYAMNYDTQFNKRKRKKKQTTTKN